MQDEQRAMIIDHLFDMAKEASKAAYCPYSGLAVGAAAIDSDNTLHVGCNVENASLGLSMCAERAALFSAVAEKCSKIEAIAVYSSAGPITPCGACRQVMAELAPEAVVYWGDKPVPVRDLLPHPFGASSLPSSRQ